MCPPAKVSMAMKENPPLTHTRTHTSTHTNPHKMTTAVKNAPARGCAVHPP